MAKSPKFKMQYEEFCDSPMRSIFPNPTPPYVTITI